MNEDELRTILARGVGISNLRNPALASHAFHMLPYRGLGSGIPRATEAWPDIELIDDRRGNQFKAVIRRPHTGEVAGDGGTKSGPSGDQVGGKFHLTAESRVFLSKMHGEHAITELMEWAERSSRTKFRDQLLTPLLKQALVEMTIPEKPNSSKQRYRLTDSGQALLAEKNNRKSGHE